MLNEMPVKLPNGYMTIKDLVEWKNIPAQGTAVAVNDKLVKQDLWDVTHLNELDQVTVISGAYGG